MAVKSSVALVKFKCTVGAPTSLQKVQNSDSDKMWIALALAAYLKKKQWQREGVGGGKDAVSESLKTKTIQQSSHAQTQRAPAKGAPLTG
jgi:hypothetical protein